VDRRSDDHPGQGARRAEWARPGILAESAGSEDSRTMPRQGTELASRTAACSKIAMSLAMGYMLLTML
jgi:hypothetical protein